MNTNFKNIKVDLHCHSYYSDGECSPAEILTMALANGVEILALTDHDTLVGSLILQDLAKGYPIRIISGVECSVSWQRMELHVVGLNVDPKHTALIHFLQAQEQRRFLRALQISNALSQQGFSDNLLEVIEIAGHYGLSRTHFAKYLVARGAVPDTATAFKKYLGSHAPAYVMSQWASLEETIAVIHQSGGVAVLAHPTHYRLSTAQLKGLIKTFKSFGGKGIEVVSGIMKVKDMNRLIQLARGFGLALSSGSDFHKPRPYRAAIGGQTQIPLQHLPIWADGNLEFCNKE